MKADSSPVVSLDKGEKHEGWWEGGDDRERVSSERVNLYDRLFNSGDRRDFDIVGNTQRLHYVPRLQNSRAFCSSSLFDWFALSSFAKPRFDRLKRELLEVYNIIADSSPLVSLEKGEKRKGVALLSFLKRDDWGRVRYNSTMSLSLNYDFFPTRIFVSTNLAWTMESVFLDIRTRSSYANASLVTRENSAKQVIMWPANADIFCLCLRHKEYFSGWNLVEIRQRLRLSYTESPASKLETYRGPLLRDPSRWLEKRSCIQPENGGQVNVAY